jgi:hypothetical protein
MTLAKADHVLLRADFIDTGRNRLMHATYAFAGFTEIYSHGSQIVLESDLGRIQAPPSHLRLTVGP